MVIVTLTTIPSRLGNTSYGESGMISTINSLLNQTYYEYEIHVNIPSTHNYTGEKYILPNWLLELETANPKLKIFQDMEDIGPATKLIPTVERIQDPESIIIVVDDDLVYNALLVEEQVANQTRFPEAVVGYDGMRSRDKIFKDVRDYFFTSNYCNSRVDILQHYKSVSYKRRYFEDDFLQFVQTNLTWHDDLLLSAYFSFKKRDRIATFHPNDPKFNSLEEWQNGGGVTTFPVLRHTAHEIDEGCNTYRQAKVDDKSNTLFKFIDNGY